MENLEIHSNDRPSLGADLNLSLETGQPTLQGDVWDYLNENNQRDTRYGGGTYIRMLRSDIRDEFLPEMINRRFSGREVEGTWSTNRKRPQNFQHEVFGYLVEKNYLGRISYEEIKLDNEKEASLQGIYYGVKSAIALLDRAQTPDYYRGYDVFPQVRAATIHSAINDGVFRDQWGASFIDGYLEHEVVNPRDIIAQQIGVICARNHIENGVLRSVCDYNQFVNASVVSTQLIIEQLAHEYYSNNVPRRTSC